MNSPQPNADVPTELLLEARRFHVERRTYTRPGARDLVRDVVVHPGAVVVLAVTAEDQIVMIRQVRHAVDEELWELPAGTREPEEAPVTTAGRELIEETGYEAAAIEPLTSFYTSPGILSESMHAFVATELTPVGQRLEEGEQIVAKLVDSREVRRMMTQGEIQDGKTLAALGVYFLGRGPASERAGV